MEQRNIISATAGNTGDKVRSDCYVSVEKKKTGGISIDIQSKVKSMYGRHMHDLTERVLVFFDIAHAEVKIIDTGALDFVIMARLEAAIKNITGSNGSFLPEFIPENDYPTQRDAFRFSRLYVPGNSPALMLNAGIHKPNGVILDLEDSVAPNKKEEARILVRNALLQVNFYGAERMVRINPLPAGLEDLKAVIPHNVHVILVPKAEKPDDLVLIDKVIRDILKDAGSDREVFLMPIIETALGVENAYLLATSTPSIVAMAIGLEDYTADIGVSRTAGGSESLYARTRLVNACKAAGIQPIDSVFSDVSDMEGLERNAKTSRALGFEGMGCIHPRQIRVIHKAFEPTPEEIEKAQKIVDSFTKASKQGLGVVSLGTKMIDLPVVKRAQRVVALANQMGIL